MALAHTYTPLAYYKFDGDYTDSGIYGYDLEVSAGTSVSIGGVLGGAYYLEGDGSGGVQINGLINSSFQNASAIRTIDFWYNWSAITCDGFVWSITNGSTSQAVSISDQTCNGQRDFTGTGFTNMGATFSSDTWYHIVILLGVGGERWYVNGQLIANNADTDVMLSTWTTLRINEDPDGGRSSDGAIDNFAVFAERYTDEDINWSYNSGSGMEFSTSSSGTEVTLISPTNNTYNNTYNQIFNYNYTFNGSTADTCFLYTNKTGAWELNITKTTGLVENTTLTIEHNFTADGEFIWNIGCNLSNGTEYFGSNNWTLIMDATNPLLSVTNFTNNTLIYNKNLSYYFTFTDDNFHSFLALLNDNVVLSNETGIGLTSYQGNITINHTNLGLTNYLYIEAADGHTAKELISDYKIKDGLFNDYLEFEFEAPYKPGSIKITQKDHSIFDTWTTKKETDRYSFNLKPSQLSSTYTFVVDSNEPIYLANNPDSKYKKWLITGQHWVDFFPYTDLTFKSISDYQVEVTINNVDIKKDTLTFNSVGDLNIVSYNYTIYGMQVETQYTNPVGEGNSHTASLFVNISNTSLADVNATLIYNGSTYINPSKTDNLINYSFSQALTAPYLENINKTSITFYWNLTTNTGSELITLTQDILNTVIDNCSDFTIRAINFTMLEDIGNNHLAATMEGYFELWVGDGNISKFNISWGLSSNHSLCIANESSSYNIYAQLEYDGEGTDYGKKNYYFANATLSNETNLINLYSTGNSTQITFEVTDENDDPIENAYVHILKYDLGTDSYTTNSILKTGTDGKDYGELLLYTTWYKFFVYKNGVLLLNTEPTKIVTTSKKLRVTLGGSYSTSYDELNQMTTSLIFNNVTKNFVYTFSNPTGLTKEFCLKVTHRLVTGDNLINFTCATTTSGTILVNIGASPEQGTYLAYGTVSGSPTLSDKFYEWKISDRGWDTYGQDGIYMTFFVKIAFAMIGIWNPVVAIVLIVLADIIMWMMGIWELSWSVIMVYIIMAGLVIWKLGRRN